ncbi:M20/M25/M40 family metallo-hydrolase [Salisediminibacterium selenitireducens]|uniref:Peptidase T-like protein n=1 Tax=Bacillus selenitireducens (strain ATCC 700615 / DSM 15326 / MLS10) TaxID=439292 RepID=D6XVK9_BACIE|nr:M20/M25/M40 family metallo-hydrolase [Salisediminibacterium selenitireducens]ADH99747.1 peptidase T-like protein [[Bacillus] selenitireducens MLS10]
MINETRLINEFLELVQVDSETRYERKIADLLTEKLTALGLEVKEDDSMEETGHGAGNLLAVLPGDKALPVVYFTVHMDTVVPGKGVTPVRENGVISSDGTTVLGADDKAGLAALLEMVRVLKEQQIPHGTIQLVITVGEESGLVGSRALKRDDLIADFGFALDSDGKVGTIITAAPYQAKIHAIMKGKKAHAGVAPENGISAITMAGKAIATMPLGRIDHETTANIGWIEGGSQTNIVCDHAELFMEARSLVKEKLDSQLDAMTKALNEAASGMGGVAELQTEHIYPGFKHDENDPIVQLAKRAAVKTGREAVIRHSGGGSDANIISGLGIPTVNLGVGYEEIHTTGESIPEAELIQAGELVVAIVQEIVAEGKG